MCVCVCVCVCACTSQSYSLAHTDTENSQIVCGSLDSMSAIVIILRTDEWLPGAMGGRWD